MIIGGGWSKRLGASLNVCDGCAVHLRLIVKLSQLCHCQGRGCFMCSNTPEITQINCFIEIHTEFNRRNAVQCFMCVHCMVIADCRVSAVLIIGQLLSKICFA